MKTMNRRDFLKLTGASAVVLTLAACGSSGGAPATPTTGKEQKLYNAINAYLAEDGCAPLVYSEGMQDAANAFAGVFKAMGSASIKVDLSDEKFMTLFNNMMDSIRDGMKKAGYPNADSEARNFMTDSYGVKFVGEDTIHLIAPYAEDKLEAQLSEFKTDTGAAGYTKEKPGYIGIATVEIDGVTYWIAAVKDAPTVA